jgi:hypothetical protein
MGFWDEFVEPQVKKFREDQEKKRQDYYDKHHPDLSAMTRAELESLRADTKIDITGLEKTLDVMRQVGRTAADHPETKDSPVGDMLRVLAIAIPDAHPASEELRDKQKLLAAINARLKPAPALPPPRPRQPRQVSKQAKNAKQMLKVEKERAQVIGAAKKAGASPETLKSIEQMFRQKLDEIKDS